MIRFATEKECEQIVSLWQEAFGDSREWVLLYLEENIENVLIYEESGQVFGMLSLLRVSYKERAGFYVYGVATGKAHRSMGVSTKLLEHAKKLAGDGFLVLVPRNQGLFEFYKGRGFFAAIAKRMQRVKPQGQKVRFVIFFRGDILQHLGNVICQRHAGKILTNGVKAFDKMHFLDGKHSFAFAEGKVTVAK